MAGLIVDAVGIAAETSGEPLSPQQELATFHFTAPSLAAELVAAEPDVVAPVAIAWDADGRLFVAEMTDYPSGPVSGRIRLLEDRDGDGRYERATVFAEQIAFPNGVLPWNGGLLVTAAPDILFFKDTNGDGHADERRVVLTGFAEGNQQLRVNGLYWGLDNWIYGANGRSDGEVRWTTELESSVNRQAGKPARQQAVSIRRRDFRFRPETKQFEAVAGHSQFGTAHDDWGNRFPVFNNIPIRHVVIEQRYLDRVPALAGTETVVPISAPEDKGRVYYLAPPTLLIPQASDYFTSACGPTVYRGDALGAEYRGNFFVCEPVHNLIQRRRLVSQGATFVAERTESGREFLASTDSWFHPVFTATGPDGCLYVVDFYRKYVEHPAWVADELKTTVPWRTGEAHGRIWRIRPKNGKPRSAHPNLSRAKSRDLVKHLEQENGWWRDTAQRLLVERQDRTVVPLLEKMARKSPSLHARLHALYTLDGLGALKLDQLTTALRDSDARIREHAIRLSEPFLAVNSNRLASSGRNSESDRGPDRRLAEARRGLSKRLEDTNPRVRLQLALTLGDIEAQAQVRAEALARLTETVSDDPWLGVAILSSMGSQPIALLTELLRQENPRWRKLEKDAEADFVRRIGALIGSSNADLKLMELYRRLGKDPGAINWVAELPLLAGLDEGIAQTGSDLLRRYSSDDWEDVEFFCEHIADCALAMASSDDAPLRFRLPAIRILGHRQLSDGGPVLVRLLTPPQPSEIQREAAKSIIARENDDEVATLALARWAHCTRLVRQQLLAGSTRSRSLGKALLDALENSAIQLTEVDSATRQALEKTPRSDYRELKERAQRLFRSAVSADREQVVKQFQPAVKMTGDRRQGAEIFARACISCHAMQGEGARVGPDLSGIATHSRETLLVDILDPSRQVPPDFVSYTLVIVEGETWTGLITAESSASVTLRQPNAPDTVIGRSRIKELKAEGKSLMPEGLEQGLTMQDMADLLSFLRQPEAALLPKEK
jgi:putative membrane-bound dehydrogenase-like protein